MFEAGELQKKYLSQAFEKFCQSPIEVALGVAWFIHNQQYNQTTPQLIPVGLVDKTLSEINAQPEYTPAGFLHSRQMDFILPQAKIDKYKADFLLVRFEYVYVDTGTPNDPYGLEPFVWRKPQIVIECDGHDFHERTKEQAQHDKARDRLMSQLGYRVLRFTGSEIFKNANECADEVELMFSSMSPGKP